MQARREQLLKDLFVLIAILILTHFKENVLAHSSYGGWITRLPCLPHLRSPLFLYLFVRSHFLIKCRISISPTPFSLSLLANLSASLSHLFQHVFLSFPTSFFYLPLPWFC